MSSYRVSAALDLTNVSPKHKKLHVSVSKANTYLLRGLCVYYQGCCLGPNTCVRWLEDQVQRKGHLSSLNSGGWKNKNGFDDKTISIFCVPWSHRDVRESSPGASCSFPCQEMAPRTTAGKQKTHTRSVYSFTLEGLPIFNNNKNYQHAKLRGAIYFQKRLIRLQ